MVDKTIEQITRTCFAWRVVHQVPNNREDMAWFEILRSHDGTKETTSVNALHAIRPGSKSRKAPSLSIGNIALRKGLMTIKALGVLDGQPIQPIQITTPPEWIESFFEHLAQKLEDEGKSVSQMTFDNFASLIQDAILIVTTPKPPPTPPPMVSLSLNLKGAL